MALDFTNRQDVEGAALYIIHDGTVHESQKFEKLKSDIEKVSQKQIIVLENNTQEARAIIDFYDILPEQIPYAFIINDNDELLYTWQSTAIPTSPDDIAYLLNKSI